MAKKDVPATVETNPHRSSELVVGSVEELLATADVLRVYGEPVERGEVTVIPAAEVMTAMGFGVGSGVSRTDRDGQVGGGGGGGGTTLSRPVAVVVASNEGVRVEPVVDVTKIALAALTAAGFMLGAWLKMRRSEREALEV